MCKEGRGRGEGGGRTSGSPPMSCRAKATATARCWACRWSTATEGCTACRRSCACARRDRGRKVSVRVLGGAALADGSAAHARTFQAGWGREGLSFGVLRRPGWGAGAWDGTCRRSSGACTRGGTGCARWQWLWALGAACRPHTVLARSRRGFGGSRQGGGEQVIGWMDSTWHRTIMHETASTAAGGGGDGLCAQGAGRAWCWRSAGGAGCGSKQAAGGWHAAARLQVHAASRGKASARRVRLLRALGAGRASPARPHTWGSGRSMPAAHGSAGGQQAGPWGEQAGGVGASRQGRVVWVADSRHVVLGPLVALEPVGAGDGAVLHGHDALARVSHLEGEGEGGGGKGHMRGEGEGP